MPAASLASNYAALLRRWLWVRRNWCLVFEVLGLTLWVEIALRTWSFTRVLSNLYVRPSHQAGRTPPPSAALVQQTIRLVYRLVPFERTCLKESLILCRLFRRYGLPAVLRIGVKKPGDRLSGHVWVEDDAGVPLTDALEGFEPMPLPSFPVHRR